MSIREMNYVWTDSKQDTSTKLLALLKIADNANDYGIAWPGISTIAKGIRQTDRNITRVIAEIEETGELFVQRRRGKSNMYLICINRRPGEIAETLVAQFGIDTKEAVRIEATIIEKQNSTPDKLSVPTSVSGTPDTAMSPDPSLTSSKNGQGQSIREREDYKRLENAVLIVCKKLDALALGEQDRVNIDKLYAMEVGAEDIRFCYGSKETSWWFRLFWKGKNGQYPTTKDLVETIGEAIAYVLEPETRPEIGGEEAWVEVTEWIAGNRKVTDFSNERTLAAVRTMGEGNLKSINEGAMAGARKRFLTIF